MGGQACVFYGAAEFSRDVDFAILAEPENLARLQNALVELQAHVIAIPSFEPHYLHIGLAVHFRCQAPGVEGLRIDLMTVMRGVDPFPALWERRTVISIDGIEANLLSLPDLVSAKKTQRAKDWPMLQRLLESHWFRNRTNPTPYQSDSGTDGFLVARMPHPRNFNPDGNEVSRRNRDTPIPQSSCERGACKGPGSSRTIFRARTAR